jgi:hypothetical protein
VLDLPGDPLAPELLSLFGYQVEMTVHLIIVEGADAGRTQAKCLGGEGTPLRTGRHSSPVPIRHPPARTCRRRVVSHPHGEHTDTSE